MGKALTTDLTTICASDTKSARKDHTPELGKLDFYSNISLNLDIIVKERLNSYIT